MNRVLLPLLLVLVVGPRLSNAASVSVTSATIRYGAAGFDTLILASPSDSIPASGVLEIKTARSKQVKECLAISHFRVSGEGLTRVLIAGGGDVVNAGDSLRWRVLASSGTQSAPFVLLDGDDRLPQSACFKDLDTDGSVDAVTIRFAVPQRWGHSFRFQLGGVVKEVLSTQLTYSPDSLLGTADLRPSPFAKGRTSLDSSDGGWMSSNGSTNKQRFPMFDSTGPVLLGAVLGNSGIGVIRQADSLFDTTILLPDTLRLSFSEPVLVVSGSIHDAVNSQLAMGPSRAPLLGYRWTQLAPTELRGILFASDSAGSRRLFPGDSVRMIPTGEAGVLVDLNGNGVAGTWVRVTSTDPNTALRRVRSRRSPNGHGFFRVDGRAVFRNGEQPFSSGRRLPGFTVYGARSK